MTISRKQQLAMAAIIVAGVSICLALLMTKPGSGSAYPQHASGDEVAPKASDAPDPKHAGDAIVRLTAAQAAAAGIQLSIAGPAKIVETREFPGEIRLDADRTAHVVARLPGVVESVLANLGQHVRKGELLATIASPALSDQRSELLAAQRRLSLADSTLAREQKLWEEKISAEQDYLQARAAREEAHIAVRNALQKLSAIGASPAHASLSRFELRAPFDGVIVEKHIALGEAVADSANIFTLSDLRSIWAEFAVAPKDLATVRVGARALISSSAFPMTVQGAVSYVGSLLGEQTRTAKAHVTLANPGMDWRPGLFITVRIDADAKEAPVAVPASAIQTIDDAATVFVQTPEGFRVQPITIGRSDGRQVEVLDGLAPGTAYASSNTFTLKAELGKASAEHGH